MNTVFFVLGIFCLAYAGFLYKKGDQKFKMTGALGLVLLAISFSLKEDTKSTQQKIENFENSLTKMKSVIDKLGATIPTPTLSGGKAFQCLAAADKTARDNLVTNIKTAVNSITTAKTALETAYNDLPEPEKSTITPTSTITVPYKKIYDDMLAKVAPFVDENITSGNPIAPKWNGMSICFDVCTSNNSSTLSATYTQDTQGNGTCICPVGYYPTIVKNIYGNDTVKCEQIDYSAEIGNYTLKLQALTSALSTTNISTPVPLKLSCTASNGSNIPCPPSAPLIIERIVTPPPTTAPLTGDQVCGAGNYISYNPTNTLGACYCKDGVYRTGNCPAPLANLNSALVNFYNINDQANDNVMAKFADRNTGSIQLNQFGITNNYMWSPDAFTVPTARSSNPSVTQTIGNVSLKAYTYVVSFNTPVRLSSINYLMQTSGTSMNVVLPARFVVDTVQISSTATSNRTSVDNTITNGSTSSIQSTVTPYSINLTTPINLTANQLFYVTIFQGILNNVATSITFSNFRFL